jgi:hypothetical protein
MTLLHNPMVSCSYGCSGRRTAMCSLAAVADECPECTATSLDFQNNFGGRDPVNWVAVQCDVGSTPFVYSFQVGPGGACCLGAWHAWPSGDAIATLSAGH